MTIAREEIFGPVLSILPVRGRGGRDPRSPTTRRTASPATCRRATSSARARVASRSAHRQRPPERRAARLRRAVRRLQAVGQRPRVGRVRLRGVPRDEGRDRLRGRLSRAARVRGARCLESSSADWTRCRATSLSCGLQRLVSLLPPEDQPATPPQIASSDHLRLLMDDVHEPHASAIAPTRSHIETLISFLRSSPQSSILIHCLAGVSRSPAAALIALALDAPGRERDVARLLRSAAPFADPNRLMIKLADEVLERRGSLVSALASMGSADLSRGFAMVDLPRLL